MNLTRLGGLVSAVLCLACPVASAAVLYTTQEDFAAASTASGAAITVGPPGATGDSDGSAVNGLANAIPGVGTPGALFLQQNTNGYQQANLGNQNGNAALIAAVKANNKLVLDYTLPNDVGPLGYFEIQAVWNSQGGGYLGFNNNPHFTAANLTAGTHTVTLDYSAQQAGLPADPVSAGNWYELFIVLNSGGVNVPQAVYVDNIRVVPEPASLGLAGLAIPALGVLVRKRKK